MGINSKLSANIEALKALKRCDFQPLKEGAFKIPLSLNGSGGAGNRSLMEMTIEALESDLDKHQQALSEAKEELSEVRTSIAKLKPQVLNPNMWGDPSFSELSAKYQGVLAQKMVLKQTIQSHQNNIDETTQRLRKLRA